MGKSDRSVPSAAESLADLLRWRAQDQADQVGYTFLIDAGAGQVVLTYAELDRRARAVAAQLQQISGAGSRALLLYPPGLDYIIAFFGCLYAGVIAVPAYPPNPARLNRSLSRLRSIVRSARPAVAMTTALIQQAGASLVHDDPDFHDLRWLATDTIDAGLADDWRMPPITGATMAFLQYTSGSTSAPKGVMLSHTNLLHNSRMIERCFEHTRDSRGVIWLPPYHDMGLIGGIIQPLYVGFPVTLMSPMDFLQRPLLWLQTISRTGATTSGGPNFAYDLCVRKIGPEARATLDLSSWTLAFNGAEPIRSDTLDRFATAFAGSGFRKEAFYPCYGLAEATLIVAGGTKGRPPVTRRFRGDALKRHRAIVDASPDGAAFVASGSQLPDHPLLIVHPERLTRCAPGEVGEIWVAGPSVAQGYWEQPAETAGAFQARLAEDGAGPFLRTGDLGFLHEEQLFVTGRLKDLIIIRGRNYYPQDIEHTVEQSHPALRPGCCAAFAMDAAGEEQLVVVQELDRQYRHKDVAPVIAAIRRALAEQHDLHLHVVVLISHGSIPKTSSGKIQRHACKAGFLAGELEVVGQEIADPALVPDEPPSLSRAELLAAAPEARPAMLELYLRQLVGQVFQLALAQVQPQHRLTELGLDSLMAVDLQHRIEGDLGVSIPLAELVEGPQVGQLAGVVLASLHTVDDIQLGDASSATYETDFPLTYGQRALWLVHHLAPERGAYHIISALRLRPPIDLDALRRTFQRLLDRHEALRTRFPLVDGQPVQHVLPGDVVAFSVEDARHWDAELLDRQLLQAAYRPFDLEHDPLLRVRLFTRATGDHVLLLVIHHLVTDFWSLALLARELPLIYATERAGTAVDLPALRTSYRAYTDWQTRQLEGPEGQRLWGYWQRQLAGPLPALDLPTDRPRPAVQRFRGASVTHTISDTLRGSARALAETNSATLSMLLLATFAILLHRYSGQDDLLIGTVTGGRSRAALADVAGYFANPLALRIQPGGRECFTDLLGQVRRTTLEAFAHQDYPFALLVERLQPERDQSRSPLFQVMFMFQQPPHHAAPELGALALGVHGVPLALGELTVESYGLPAQTAQFDLTLLAAEHHGQLLLTWNYDTDLFDAATIERIAGHFETLLEGILARPETPLGWLPLLRPGELRRLRDELNDTRADLPASCLHDLFAAQAARTPDVIALRDQGGQISYGALERRANQLAHELRGRGVGPEVLVGLCADRSAELVIGLLGILKAGGAYVPLDPSFPRERLALMLEDSRASVLITQKEIRDWRLEINDSDQSLISNLQSPTAICLDTDWGMIARQPEHNPDSGVAPDNPAYVIYTSGSTGRPKGVQIPHAAVVNFLLSMAHAPGIAAADTALLVTTLSFDIAALEIFLPLTVGACLQIVSRATLLDGAELARTLHDAGVTLMQATPATWRLLLDAGWQGEPHLKILCGGEAFPRDLAGALLARGSALWNMYGPTETTIWSAVGPVRPDAGPVTLGGPIANTQLYVLDAEMQPVPLGVPGELYIGGAGLARGYLGRPDLTAERFVPNPFERLEIRDWRLSDADSSISNLQSLISMGIRLYKTGDLARYRPDGALEFLGRMDHQVKLRGFRIELGEIETALRRHPAVREAVVVAREDVAGDQRLVAYLTGDWRLEIRDLDSSNLQSPISNLQRELRTFLKQSLPDYMLPSELVLLDRLPLTPNGKVDRKALPAPQGARGAAPQPGRPPRSALERTIAAIWCEVLRREEVGVHDNFFDLGGHSMLLAQVHSRLRAVLPGDLSIIDLFQYPTIDALARHLGGDAAPAPKRTRRIAVGPAERAVAIIGMAGRFPGAGDIDQFWHNLRDGVESITFFSEQELLDAGEPPAALRAPNYVRARATLADADLFDAAFFGYTPREAEILDPQHRLFLETAWAALEHAGYDSERYQGRVGVFAGVGINSYLLEADRARIGAAGRYQAFISNDKDFVPTRVSYKLNLRGPSVNIQTACSSSLVAVHLACQSLLCGESDMALAGGVTISVPQQAGYLYEEGGIPSPDGHCRAFDEQACGTVFGSGVGVVLLKPLADALADGDTIHAVIKGSAINNDGAAKVGYTAPSVDGQAEVIGEALAAAQVAPQSIGYIEAHGTATALGDPIEIAALTQAYREHTEHSQFCALGSVKTNIGHLDTAAGVAGLIKTTLALRHAQIPPSLHFRRPNPNIDFAASPFFVNAELRDWPAGETPRRAGVSSFGIGGTNAHAILEQAPAPPARPPARPWHLLPLAARSPGALDTMTARLAMHLRASPDADLADIAYTLQVGRRAFEQRRVVICRDTAEALALLDSGDPQRVLSGAPAPGAPGVVFMFPGQGAQYAGMGAGLYESEPVFRQWVDRCAELLLPRLGLDIREVLYPDDRQPTTETNSPAHPLTRSTAQDGGQWSVVGGQELDQTWLAQPALFVVEYALAQVWMSWGVRPSALIGHSVGEYVAACLAGVFALEDALRLVAARGRMMQALPAGAMLGVSISAHELLPLLGPGLDLAAVNGPQACVVAGPEQAIEALARQLAARDLPSRRLHTSHAFHSAMMDALVAPFAAEVQGIRRNPPQIPFISNVSGGWITAEEATDPQYWARHLRRPVRFAEGVATLLAQPDRLLLEVGPGQTLGSLARRVSPQCQAIASMRHPNDPQPDQAALLKAAGRLWLANVQLDWLALHAGEPRRRVPLPTYHFEHKRFWIGRPAARQLPDAPATGRAPLDDWFSTPLWRQTLPPAPPRPQADGAGEPWLVFADGCGLGDQLCEALAGAGRRALTVIPGPQFAALGPGCFQIQPGCRDDYDALLSELAETALLPRVIVHAWSAGTPEPCGATRLERARTLGFDSLLLLAQALARLAAPTPITIGVITNGMQRIAGEHVYAPEQAIMLGLCKVIPQELPALACLSIDIALERDGSPPPGLGALVLAELSAPGQDTVLAYRDGARWVQSFEPLRLEPAGSNGTGPALLRQGGVYLITGGLGGIGLTLAGELARSTRARLALMGRGSLPARAEWPRQLAEGPEATRAQIRAIEAIEAQGGEVLVLAADVADPAQVRAAVEQVVGRFGALHGVIHAAGVAGGGMLQLKTPEAATRVLMPKLQGTLALYEATCDLPLDFIVLCSSITAVTGGFGQADYCGANAFLDAFAAAAPRRGPRVIAINWDRWRQVGMAARTSVPEDFRTLQQGGLPIQHPLLDRCLLNTGERAIYWSEFSVERQWVLSEHLIAGRPTVPGTTYLEMARAVFAHATRQATAELRDVVFVAPLTARAGERRDVLTILERRGDSYDFRIVGRLRPEAGAPGRWSEHARGTVRAAAMPPAGSAPADLIDGLAPLDLAEALAPGHNGEGAFLVTGPRWDNLRQVFAGGARGVALLELGEPCAGDLRDYTLHPALLDTAAGAVRFMGEGDYLPLTYGSLRVYGAFPRRIYSAIRYKNGATRDVLTCDIAILSEQGQPLAQIDGFSMRRITPEVLAQLKTQAGDQPAMLIDDATGEIYDELVAPALEAGQHGIAPEEGAQIFARVLGSRVARVIVSTGDLRQELARVNSLTTARLLDRLAQARPPAGPAASKAPAAASAGEIEQRVIGIWRQVLGIEQISVNDNFFELGGTSLLGIQVIAEMKAVFGVDIPAVSIFEAPTIGALVRYLQPAQPGPIFDHSRDRARKREQALGLFKGEKR